MAICGTSLGDLEECETEGPVTITRNGKAVAVLLAPLDEEDLERIVLSRSPRFLALLNKSRRSVAAGKGLPRNQFWKAVEQRHRQRHKKIGKTPRRKAMD